MFGNNPTYRLLWQSVKQGLQNQGWSEKYATGIPNAKIKVAKQKLKIGIWNLRSLRGEAKIQLLLKEIKSYNFNIVGLAELWWKGKGNLKNSDMVWSGNNSNATVGVGFLLNKSGISALTGSNQINSRIIVARLRDQPLNISVV